MEEHDAGSQDQGGHVQQAGKYVGSGDIVQNMQTYAHSKRAGGIV